MTTMNLAKKALKYVNGCSFRVSAFSSSGATCDCDWDDSEAGYLELDKAEVLEQVKETLEIDDTLKGMIDIEELFQGIETKYCDIEESLSEIAFEAAWPDGGPIACLQNFVPNELESLADEINDLDKFDDDYAEKVDAIREQLQAIQTGNYTLCADISAYDGDYVFAEDEQITIQLSAEKAWGILYNYCDNDSISKDSLFDGIDYEETNENDVQAIVNEQDFKDYADTVSGICDELDNYTNAWCQFIYAICNGDVNEDNFDDCITFFDEAYFNDEDESDFENWLEEHNYEDEEEE